MAENDKVKNEAKIERVVFPKEGGVLTYIQGHPYPYRGFPLRSVVEKIGFIKAMIPALGEIFRLIPKWKLPLCKDAVFKIVKGAFYLLEKDRLKPDKYSQPVREIYRLFNLLIEREVYEEKKKQWQQLRDITCMILEFDSSYRLRVQDVLSELNIDEIKLSEEDKYFAQLRTDFNFNLCQKKK